MKIMASFKHKRIGFYLSLIGVISLLVASIVYMIGFSTGESDRFYNGGALLVAIVATIVFVVLSLFKATERYVALPVWLLSLLSFLLFILGSYMYLSEVFYSGISAETLKNLRIDYIIPVVAYLFSVIILNVALFNKQSSDNNVKVVVEECKNGYFAKDMTKKNKIITLLSTVLVVGVTAAVIGVTTPNYIPVSSGPSVDTGLVVETPEINMDLGVAPTANIVAHASEGYVVSYKSLNPEIAIVDNTGMVTAIDRGTATINVISKLAGRPKALETKTATINIDAPADFYQMKTGTEAKNGNVVANPGNWYFYTLTTSGTRISYVANQAVNLTFNGVDANKEWYLRYQPQLPANQDYIASMTVDINVEVLARFAPNVVYQKLYPGTNKIKISRKMSSSTPFSMTLLSNETPEEAATNRKNYSGNFSMKITNIVFGQPLEFNQDSFAIDMNQATKTAQIEVTDPSSSAATFTYESLDPTVATVSNTGLITGLKEGDTTIKVTSSTGNKGEVTVSCSYHYVTLNKSRGFIDVDKNPTDQLTFESDEPSIVTFSSSDETIATVTNAGVVTGIKKGNVTITATCGAAQAICAYCVVKPSELPTEYTMETASSADSAKDANVINDPGIWHSYANGHSQLTSSAYSTVGNKGRIDFTLAVVSKTVYFRYRPSLDFGASYKIKFIVTIPEGYSSGSGTFKIAGTTYPISAGDNAFMDLPAMIVSDSKPFTIQIQLPVAGSFAISGIEVIEL